MNKRMLAIIAAVVLIIANGVGFMGNIPVAAEENELRYENLTYEINPDGETINILDCDDNCVDLIIPETIEGKEVTRLDFWDEPRMSFGGLSEKPNLKTVSLPKSLKKIGAYCFSDCPKLTQCDIPSSVEHIGRVAFRNTPLIQKKNGISYVGNWVIEGDKNYIKKHGGSATIRAGTVGISEYAFGIDVSPWDLEQESYLIVSVSLPDGLQHINSRAFIAVASLKSINLPKSLKTIGASAFSSCESLTSISLPDGVCIKDSAFSYSNLKTVKCQGTLKEIGLNVFEETPWLKSQQKNTSLVCLGGFLIDGTKAKGEITIEDGVIIAEHAFAENDQITKVTLKCSQLFESAFEDCTSLQSVSISSNIKTIPCSAFKGCSSLASISLPNSITEISSNAFEECSSLTSISLPNSITEIGSNAFEECSSLTSISLPNSIAEIGSGTFSGCSSLTSISLPNSITEIGHSAFYNCSSLKEISLPNSLKTIGTYCWNQCTALESVTFSSSLSFISDFCFEGCDSLKQIEIPSNIKTIGERAFHCCRRLCSVDLSEGIEVISDRAFQGCHSLSEITIPRSCKSIGEFTFDSADPSTDEIVEVEGDPRVVYAEDYSFLNKIIILNPDCEISDSKSTISSGANYSIGCFMGTFLHVYEPYSKYYYSGMIIGQKDSTAEQYAEKWGYNFEEYLPFILGDINLDGKLSIADAVLLSRCVAEDNDLHLNDKSLERANVDEIGTITSDDITSLLKILVKS